MLVTFTQVQLVGLLSKLDETLRVLQQARAVELTWTAAPGGDSGATLPDRAQDDELLGRVESLLSIPAGGSTAAGHPGPAGTGLDGPALRPQELPELVSTLERELAAVDARLDQARSESATLPRYLGALSALEPLVPSFAELDDRDFADLRLATVALVLDDPQEHLMRTLREQLSELLGARHLLVSSPPHDGTVGALLVVPTAEVSTVEDLLGTDRIVRESLPAAYRGRSLRTSLAGMRERAATLPGMVADLEAQRAAVVAPHVPALRAAAASLSAAVERQHAATRVTRTERTFIVNAWVPRHAVREVREALATQASGPTVLTEVKSPRSSAPVLLRNPRPARPFERLVGFLSWPRPDGLDPSVLMAFALPLLFGVMVGDVVYGLALVLIGALLLRRTRDRALFMADLARVLIAGGIWATVFGVLFGEALGSLGNKLGMPALWFYRGGPEALEPLLLFALALGAVHVVLGLVLGVWMAVRHRHLRHAAERVGSLLVLIGLFVLVAVFASLLPDGFLTPAIAAAVVGLVLICVAPGALGLLLGPLELLGTIGNILSYLRLAAVGLASVYLANVANELAASAPLLLGILVATLFHVLNLALAAFSPMVQSLRLHYVEFFSKFHDGGGRPFQPLGAGLPPGVPPVETPTATTPAVAASRS